MPFVNKKRNEIESTKKLSIKVERLYKQVEDAKKYRSLFTGREKSNFLETANGLKRDVKNCIGTLDDTYNIIGSSRTSLRRYHGVNFFKLRKMVSGNRMPNSSRLKFK